MSQSNVAIVPLNIPIPKKTRSSCKRILSLKGFTLIEIMVAVAILAFGITAVYRSFFVSLDVLDYYSNYLFAQGWLNDKVWDLQDRLMRSEAVTTGDKVGAFMNENKDFIWRTSVNPVDENYGAYRLDLTLSWMQGNREINVYRGAYAVQQEVNATESAS